MNVLTGVSMMIFLDDDDDGRKRRRRRRERKGLNRSACSPGAGRRFVLDRLPQVVWQEAGSVL